MTMTHEDRLANCCTPSRRDSTAPRDTTSAALTELRSEETRADTAADVAAIRSAGFMLLLETGRPVTVEDLIAATDVSAERVTEIFASVRARGRVEFDEEGRLIGLAGLTLTPGRHELTVNGTTRWTWCALDAVGILGALEATGAVKSTDPQTGETTEIAFVEGRPDTDAHLFVLGGYAKDDNVREDWCPLVNFFASRRAADKWVGTRGLEGDIVAVADITGDAAAMWRPVVDAAAPQVC